jgi:hypothetical protein
MFTVRSSIKPSPYTRCAYTANVVGVYMYVYIYMKSK